MKLSVLPICFLMLSFYGYSQDDTQQKSNASTPPSSKNLLIKETLFSSVLKPENKITLNHAVNKKAELKTINTLATDSKTRADRAIALYVLSDDLKPKNK